MSFVRVREPAIVTPEGGEPVVLVVGKQYRSDDPIVREFGWAFESDNVEMASAAPGEKRTATRRAS